ncbi:mono/diheme cytochrome c family protein [Panacagrimonas perspica]|uniref:Mono/diheme cytochrome c family protein n=1 Tax=Panacagrimonas perspica TaxID=381431 RepID=A0A4V3F615_9GAMM|nr:cytochrome c [Panacagrimonas perspica]TDU31066.1 mono/diheme cytochrome c family protein [Panacagrimonas perspica]THD01792.1 alcohol dehydrogenase [Panacagrimonas perspica]
MSRALRWVLGLVLVLVAVVASVGWLGLRGDSTPPGIEVPRVAADRQDTIERGAYLATAANCRGCHTARGGAAYAGGRAIPTPFGTFHAPNITPDGDTGIGRWTDDDFWRALHEGKRPDGAPLYPSFPYTHYTKLDRADSDAILAYLRSLAPVALANRPHELNFPYDQRWLLVAWRALFFRPGVFEADATQDARWNRGAYFVQGLGHCGACHEARNALGATVSRDNPAGGVVLSWYAPTLESSAEAGVSHWSEDEIVALLHDGVSAKASAMGPMAEVVHDSLQHLDEEDVRAMASYLRGMPDREVSSPRALRLPSERERLASLERGASGYAKHCADCHGEQGEGHAPSAPALAGNRALTMSSSVNPIRTILYGGYAPGTTGNPQPFGMPPYYAQLSNGEIADILSYLRTSWGNQAAPVADYEVQRQRTGPLW